MRLEWFLAGASDGVRRALERETDLATRVDAFIEAAGPCDESALLAHAASKLPDVDPAAALDALEAADLWLAVACARGDESAAREVERRLEREVPAALSRLRASTDEIDEIGQMVREKILVGAAPKILEYAGRGTLVAWLRAVIVRTAISARRAGSDALERDTSTDDDLAFRASSFDPERDAMQARYATAYTEVLRDALRRLSVRDRTILKMYFVDGMSIDAIGDAYDVHRATAARWIGRCREHIADETRRLLADRLRVPAGELDSLGRMCMSQVDFSLRGALEAP